MSLCQVLRIARKGINFMSTFPKADHCGKLDKHLSEDGIMIMPQISDYNKVYIISTFVASVVDSFCNLKLRTFVTPNYVKKSN